VKFCNILRRYVKTVYSVRLRLFPADSKEIREVESTVFEYALLLLLAYARANEQPSVVRKVALWSIDAAQRGLAACGKKPPAQVAPVVSREDLAASFERSLRGESRTKELQVQCCVHCAHATDSPSSDSSLQARVKTMALHLLRIYHLLPHDVPSMLSDFDARAHAKKFLGGMSVIER
jgi:hypothetical protein